MMRIDIDAVLRERVPLHYRYMPQWFVRWLERLICQDRLNELLEHNAAHTGADFAWKIHLRKEENNYEKNYLITHRSIIPSPLDM